MISAHGLDVRLDGHAILRSISFDVTAGSWVGLIGPNGSGKSTLLRTMAGLLPYDGQLRLRDREIRQWTARELAREVAFLQQSTSIVFDLSVRDLVLLGRSPHHGWFGDFDASDRASVEAALRRVDISELADRSVLTLSGGELQRALLAQTIVQDTPILFLDEPTAHLDVHHQFELVQMVGELSAAGRTIVTVFHDLEMAMRHASHLLVLDRGSIAADGPPEDVVTADLLARVFRMRADVETSDGITHIRYLSPVQHTIQASS